MIYTLAPLAALLAYFFGALLIFAWRGRRGMPLDPEVESRPASLLLGKWIRNYIFWVLGPYERGLVRLGVSPNLLTFASLACACAAAVALASGRFGLGGWLYLLTGIFDLFDGRIARATGSVSPSGAFLDSVVDRYAELAVFAGLAYYYRATPVLPLALLATIGSLMVSYTRARAEGLGIDVRIGTMQRPERLFYLGVIIAHAPIYEALWPSGSRPIFPPAVAALALLGLSANVTAVRRIIHTMRILDPVS